jgi:hypothetical protein
LNADIQTILNQIQEILNSVLNVLQVIATFLIAFLVVLWLTLCFWAFRDIQSRTRDMVAQIFATLMVLFLNFPGVLIYMLVRPKETLAQSYERSLQEEYMLQDLEEREICPSCRVKTQPDFLFCFNCRTRLRRECTGCNQLVKVKWASCPYCATPQKVRSRESSMDRAGLGAGRTNQSNSSPTNTNAGRAIVPTGSTVNGAGIVPPPAPPPHRGSQPTQSLRNSTTNKFTPPPVNGGNPLREEETTLYGPNVDINDPAVQDYYDKNNKDPRQPPPPRK